MPEKGNKVQFNLKNVHYAILKESEEDGAISWDTPVHVPGAVTLALDPEGEMTPFYADGIAYYRSVANNGYSGDLEMAKYPDQMLQDVWGYTLTETENVIVENSNVEPKSFALLFQIDGDIDNEFYCMYNAMGTRPGIGSTTNTDTKEPQTQSSTITASPLEDGRVMAKTTATTTPEVKTNWFKKVYEPAASLLASASNVDTQQETQQPLQQNAMEQNVATQSAK